jgi:hypothetical protein
VKNPLGISLDVAPVYGGSFKIAFQPKGNDEVVMATKEKDRSQPHRLLWFLRVQVCFCNLLEFQSFGFNVNRNLFWL